MSMNPWWQAIGFVLFFMILLAPVYLWTAEMDEEGGDNEGAGYGEDGSA